MLSTSTTFVCDSCNQESQDVPHNPFEKPSIPAGWAVLEGTLSRVAGAGSAVTDLKRLIGPLCVDKVEGGILAMFPPAPAP